MTGMFALCLAFGVMACVSPWLGLLAVAPWVAEYVWEALR